MNQPSSDYKSPVLPLNYQSIWRWAEVSIPTRVLAVPTVFKTVLAAEQVNPPYMAESSAIEAHPLRDTTLSRRVPDLLNLLSIGFTVAYSYIFQTASVAVLLLYIFSFDYSAHYFRII